MLLVLPSLFVLAMLAIVIVALEFLLVFALLFFVQLLLAFALLAVRVHLIAIQHTGGVKDVGARRQDVVVLQQGRTGGALALIFGVQRIVLVLYTKSCFRTKTVLDTIRRDLKSLTTRVLFMPGWRPCVLLNFESLNCMPKRKWTAMRGGFLMSIVDEWKK